MSFEEIVNEILSTCLKHKQVNASDYGDLLKKLKGTSYNYPLCFLTDGKSDIKGSMVNLAFSLVVCDKLIHNESNELTVLSNCLSIGIDIIGQLQFMGDQYQLDYRSVGMSPFIDSFPDVLGGWRFEINILIPENYNSCDAPFTV